jgi:hypothetical protein
MLDLVGVQVRWKGGGIEQAGEKLCTGLFVHKGIISVVNMVEYVSDRILYIIPKGHWCHIILINFQAPKDDNIY